MYRICLTNRIESISRRITQLVINSLRGGHTHANTHTYTDDLHRINIKKPGAPENSASNTSCISCSFHNNKNKLSNCIEVILDVNVH